MRGARARLFDDARILADGFARTMLVTVELAERVLQQIDQPLSCAAKCLVLSGCRDG
jgi:hypothetical protein